MMDLGFLVGWGFCFRLFVWVSFGLVCGVGFTVGSLVFQYLRAELVFWGL